MFGNTIYLSYSLNSGYFLIKITNYLIAGAIYSLFNPKNQVHAKSCLMQSAAFLLK